MYKITRHKKYFNNQLGLTLIEILTSVAILTLVVALGYSIIFFTYDSFDRSERSSEVRQNVRLITNYITQELRNATHVEIFSAESFDIENGLPPVFDEESSDIYGFFYIHEFSDDNNNVYHFIYHKKPNKGGLGEVIFSNLIKGVNLSLSIELDETGYLNYSITENTDAIYDIHSGLQFLNYDLGKFKSSGESPGVAIAYSIKRSLGWHTIVTDLWYMDLMANEELGEGHDDYCDKKANDKSTFDTEREVAGLLPYKETIKTGIWDEMINNLSYEFKIIPFIENNSIHIEGKFEGRGAYFSVDIERYVKDINNYTLRFDSRLKRDNVDYHTQGWGIVFNAALNENNRDAGYMYQFDPGASGFVMRRNNFDHRVIYELGVYDEEDLENGSTATYTPSKINNDYFAWNGIDNSDNEKWFEDYTSEITVQKQIDGSFIFRSRIWETAKGREYKAEDMWFGDFGEVTYDYNGNSHTFQGQEVVDGNPSNNQSLYEFPNSAGGTYLGFRSWARSNNYYYAEFNHLHLSDGFSPMKIEEANFLVYKDSNGVKYCDELEIIFDQDIRLRTDRLCEDEDLITFNSDNGNNWIIYNKEIIDGKTLRIELKDTLTGDDLPDHETGSSPHSITIKRGGVRHINKGDIEITNGNDFPLRGYRIIIAELSIREQVLEGARIGEHYSHQFRARGGTGPYGFTTTEFATTEFATTDTLPDWLNLEPDNGTLSGVPPDSHTGGSYSITIQVEDSKGDKVTRKFDFTVYQRFMDDFSDELDKDNWDVAGGSAEIKEKEDSNRLKITSKGNVERGWVVQKDLINSRVIEFDWLSDDPFSGTDMRVKFLAKGDLDVKAAWSQTGYQIQWETWNHTDNHPLRLYRLNGSTATLLASKPLPRENHNWNTMRIEITDTLIKVYHNDELYLQSTDSTYREAGNFILGGREGTGTEGTRVVWYDKLRIHGDVETSGESP